jgi:uncharacterized protein
MTAPGGGWQPPPPGYWYPPPPPPGYWYPPPPPGYWYPPPPPPAYWWPPPPGMPPPWAKVPKPPPHDVPQPFLHVMRSRTWRWWKPLLGLLLFAVVYAVGAILAVALTLVALLPGARELLPDLASEDLTDPRVLLVTNVSLMVAIPVLWLVWAAVHQMRIGWSSSVLGRLRWRLFLPWTLLALATIGVAILASVGLDVAFGVHLAGPAGDVGWLVAVVLLTTPLQSAAEEYVFRGYLSQAIAGWFRDERTGAIVAGLLSAALFSLAHAPPDVIAFADRFAVGLACSAVVRMTGGLEASIALHTVNNVVIFLLAGALGDSESTGSGATEGVLSLVLTLAALGGYVALVSVVRRRVQPELRTPALDLRPGVFPPLPDPSGIVSPWRREVPDSPWGMG